MLYTSYYAKQKDNKTNNLIAISQTKPSWLEWPNQSCHLVKLAPPKWLVWKYKQCRTISEEEFEEQYLLYLNQNKEEILDIVRNIPDESILLCYERVGAFCHRHILAKWLNGNNIKIVEWDYRNM